jgi:hypothetical protein
VACNSPARTDTSDAALAEVPDSAATLKVEVGSGNNNFVPLDDGTRVEVISGPQGGYHLWTSVRVHDPTVAAVQINLSVRFEDSGAAAGKPSRVAASLEFPKDGARDRVGMTNFVNDPNEVRGKRVILRAEVVAADQRHGADEHVVVVE